VESEIPYTRLHANVRSGIVRALIVAALEISTGRTTLFSELAEGTAFRPSRDPRRVVQPADIDSDHVLAAAANPLLFPARRSGAHYYSAAGVRSNTPIAPATRCGGERLVVVSRLYTQESALEEDTPEAEANVQAYPSPI